MEKVMGIPGKNSRKLRSKKWRVFKEGISSFLYKGQNLCRPHFTIDILFFARYHVPAKRS
jgi:hypothetical protein